MERYKNTEAMSVTRGPVTMAIVIYMCIVIRSLFTLPGLPIIVLLAILYFRQHNNTQLCHTAIIVKENISHTLPLTFLAFGDGSFHLLSDCVLSI